MVRGEWREYLGRGVTEEEEEEEGKGNWKKGCRRWCNALCFDFKVFWVLILSFGQNRNYKISFVIPRNRSTTPCDLIKRYYRKFVAVINWKLYYEIKKIQSSFHSRILFRTPFFENLSSDS